MLFATILVCVRLSAPCLPDDSDWLIRVPGAFPTPTACLMAGQLHAAESTQVPVGANFRVFCGQSYLELKVMGT
jgi:hypothetical protein